MCKVIKVNRSAYYNWVQAGCIVNKVDNQLNELIQAIFVQGRSKSMALGEYKISY